MTWLERGIVAVILANVLIFLLAVVAIIDKLPRTKIPPTITARVTDGSEASARSWICHREADAGFTCEDAVPVVAKVLEVYGAKQGCSL
jgi:hypothetical protein